MIILAEPSTFIISNTKTHISVIRSLFSVFYERLVRVDPPTNARNQTNINWQRERRSFCSAEACSCWKPANQPANLKSGNILGRISCIFTANRMRKPAVPKWPRQLLSIRTKKQLKYYFTVNFSSVDETAQFRTVVATGTVASSTTKYYKLVL